MEGSSEKIDNEKLKNLSENERHFFTIQAGIRGLASTWTLAAFGAMAFLLDKDKSIRINSTISIISIILLFNICITVLWVIDQKVYQRLFNSYYIAGLRLEQQYPSIPPVRAIQAITTGGKSIASWIKFFYLAPIFAFATFGLIIVLRDCFIENTSLANNYLKSLNITISLISFIPGVWLIHHAHSVSFFIMVRDLPGNYSQILSKENCSKIITNHLLWLDENKSQIGESETKH